MMQLKIGMMQLTKILHLKYMWYNRSGGKNDKDGREREEL